MAALHAEYIERGGRFYACPVCVKSRGLEDAEWVQGAEVKGVPSRLEFTQVARSRSTIDRRGSHIIYRRRHHRDAVVCARTNDRAMWRRRGCADVAPLPKGKHGDVVRSGCN